MSTAHSLNTNCTFFNIMTTNTVLFVYQIIINISCFITEEKCTKSRDFILLTVTDVLTSCVLLTNVKVSPSVCCFLIIKIFYLQVSESKKIINISYLYVTNLGHNSCVVRKHFTEAMETNALNILYSYSIIRNIFRVFLMLCLQFWETRLFHIWNMTEIYQRTD